VLHFEILRRLYKRATVAFFITATIQLDTNLYICYLLYLFYMGKVYCIYSDIEIDVTQTSPEHIIPLSLGGCNDFCISVEKNINSKLGSAIDGKLANDFLIASIRKAKKYFGHSKTPFKVAWNKSSFKNGKPIIVTLSDDGVQIFDPVRRALLNDKEIEGVEFESQFKIDTHIRSLFVTKTALSAGYFVYGDTFKKYADHKSLRKYIEYGIDRTKKEELRNLPLRIVDPFLKVEEKDNDLKGVFEMICKATNDSCVFFILCATSIIVSVGIGGTYIGSVTFNAQTEHFPNDEKFRLGHVVAIQKKVLTRSSFYDVVAIINNNLNDLSDATSNK